MYHKAADVVCVRRSTVSTSRPGGARALALLSSRPPGRFVGKETVKLFIVVIVRIKLFGFVSCHCTLMVLQGGDSNPVGTLQELAHASGGPYPITTVVPVQQPTVVVTKRSVDDASTDPDTDSCTYAYQH